jgi:hypothetical protein
MSDTAQSDEKDAASAAAVTPDDDQNALATRLRVIEEQPLETRAESLAELHDELRAMLEAGDAPPHA